MPEILKTSHINLFYDKSIEAERGYTTDVSYLNNSASFFVSRGSFIFQVLEEGEEREFAPLH